MSSSKKNSAAIRLVFGPVIVMVALLLLAAGWLIPFQYESFSILYKFGLEKTFLRSGKVIGITIVLLIFYQLLLASRFALFEWLFSVKPLFTLHRINGMVIAFLAAVHPLLIKASENFTPYTLDKKYYPEFVGIGLLFILLVVSLTAVFRNNIKIAYKKWLLGHRLGVTLVLGLMPVHVLFVSETFKSGIPRTAALAVFSLNLLLIGRIWLRRILL